MIRKILQAVKILKGGGVVAFPTETVYGLGACCFNQKAVKKIYSIKKRPFDNPLIVHIGNRSQLKTLTRNVPPVTHQLIRKFWPGPLTLVLKRSSKVPLSVTAGLDTVAVRMPSHPMALALIRSLGEPIAAPSANRSTRPSPTRYEDVVNELGGRVDFILNGGEAEVGLESTVVDLTHSPVRILRPGFVTLENLKKIVPEVVSSPEKSGSSLIPSPGVRHRHYQPSCAVILVDPAQWNKTFAPLKGKDLRLGVVSYSKKIPAQPNIVYRREHHRDKLGFARNLYRHFYDAEKAKVDLLFIESIDDKGLGRAIMDRLSRASEPSSRLH